MKKLMIFGASVFQIPLIEAAKKRGLHTCVLDINPHAPARDLSDEFHECSIKSFERALEIAEKYKSKNTLYGIIYT